MNTDTALPSDSDETPPPNNDNSTDDVKLPNMDMDKILHYLGRFGRYQLFQLLIVHLCLSGISIPILHGMFVGKHVDFRCTEEGVSFQRASLPANQTVILSHCHIEIQDNLTSEVLHTESCRKHSYGGGDDFVSYLAEWDLVCDKEVSGQLPQILLLVGQFFGATFFPQIGDKYGRKKLIILGTVVLSISMTVSAFVKDFEFFLILRFLIGAAIQICMVPGVAMVCEILPTNTRAWMIVMSTIGWPSSMALNGLTGYLLQNVDWRMVQLAYALMAGFLSITSLFFLDESLTWLAGNSKRKEMETLLKKACSWNKKDFRTVMKIAVSDEEHQPMNDIPDQENRSLEDDACKPIDIVKHRNTRKIAGIACFTWMVASLSYYGIVLMSTSLSGDPYVNYFLTASLEIPAGILGFCLLNRVNRKTAAISLSIGSASALLLSVLVVNVAPSQPAFATLQTCLILVGHFFVIDLFLFLWIYTQELYPTNLRNIGVGISSGAARVGSSFSPLFTILARKVPWAPGALFGGGCLISAFLFTMLPETLGVPLPNTLKDVDNMFQKSKKKNKPLSPQIVPGDT